MYNLYWKRLGSADKKEGLSIEQMQLENRI